MANAEIDAMQDALAGVHAAVWGYGLLTPRLSGAADQTRARQAFKTYRDLRVKLEADLGERKVKPVAAEPSYRTPFPVDGAAAARKLAIHLENGCAGVFGHLVAGASDAELRTWAADRLTEAARRAIEWGAEIQALPGLVDS